MNRRYKAFISYAHGDESLATWLHRSLEKYRVPQGLRQRHGHEKLPPRLHPVFRDCEELASSADLSQSIRSALEQSDTLIVICSPQSARSRWVNEEIRYFQSLGLSHRILSIIVEGSTEPSDPRCAFPIALLQTEDGTALPEPLAADIQDAADGKRNAFLKIVAGILDVGVDDIKQRDSQRQLRFRTSVSGGAIVISLVMAGLAISAQLAREDAELRREQAENLINFMLEDLRSRLEPVGRLDLLDAVGQEAMDYFTVLGDRGTPEEVFARAMALRQIGEVRFRQGQLSGAQAAFEDSRNITASLVESSPENPRYLFELGQSEFWIGYAAHEQSLTEQSGASYRKYMDYGRQLVAADPDNPEYQLELMYAYSNLGGWELDAGNPAAALVNFDQCLAINQRLVNDSPKDHDLQHELANTYSWIGETRAQLGQLVESEKSYRSAVDNLSPLHESGNNRLASEHYGQNIYHLGNVTLNRGDIDKALSLFREAHHTFSELVAFDNENTIWQSDRGISAYYLAQTLIQSGDQEAGKEHLVLATHDFETSLKSDSRDLRVVESLALAEQLLASTFREDNPEEAIRLSFNSYERVQGLIDGTSVKPRTVLAVAQVALMRGELLARIGESPRATEVWQDALNSLSGRSSTGLTQLAVERKLRQKLGYEQDAVRLYTQLTAAGFQDPRYL